MPRYKLRTLLILLAVLPPLLAVGWSRYAAWKAEQERLNVAKNLPHDDVFFLPIIDGQGEPSPRPGLVPEVVEHGGRAVKDGEITGRASEKRRPSVRTTAASPWQ